MKDVGIILLGVIFLYFVAVAWPVSMWFIAAVLAYRASEKATTPWMKALASIAGPSAIGLSIVFVLVLALNWLPGTADPTTVRGIEEFFIALDRWTRWLKPSPLVFACTLAGLLLVSRFVARGQLVTKSLAWQKRLSKPIAVVALVSNFTFFSADSLIRPLHGMLEARYRNLAERKNKATGRMLALEAVRLALLQSAPPQLATLGLLGTTIAFHEELKPRWKKGGARQWTTTDMPDATLGGVPVPEGPMPEPRPSRTASFQRYDSPTAAEEGAVKAERAMGETERAVRQVASDLLSAAEKSVSDGVWLYIEGYVDRYAEGLGEYVRNYGEKVTGTLREKLISTVSDRIVGAWSKATLRTAGSTAESLKAEFRIAMTEAAVQESISGTSKAKDAVERVKSASAAGSADEAERWAKAASAAADDAVEAARFANATAGLDAAIGVARTEKVGASAFALGAVAAAETARLASGSAAAARAAQAAAAAARAAEDATAAVRAARAAESAAAAARAAEGLKAVRILVP